MICPLLLALLVWNLLLVHSEHSGEHMLSLKWSLQGLVPTDTFSMHIHGGRSCDNDQNVGDHLWNPAFTLDPWNDIQYPSTNEDGFTKGVVSVDCGFAVEKVVGHVLVVHSSNGTRLACGYISPKNGNIRVELRPYPGYTGQLNLRGVVLVEASQEMELVSGPTTPTDDDEPHSQPDSSSSSTSLSIESKQTTSPASQRSTTSPTLAQGNTSSSDKPSASEANRTQPTPSLNDQFPMPSPTLLMSLPSEARITTSPAVLPVQGPAPTEAKLTQAPAKQQLSRPSPTIVLAVAEAETTVTPVKQPVLEAPTAAFTRRDSTSPVKQPTMIPPTPGNVRSAGAMLTVQPPSDKLAAGVSIANKLPTSRTNFQASSVPRSPDIKSNAAHTVCCLFL